MRNELTVQIQFCVWEQSVERIVWINNGVLIHFDASFAIFRIYTNFHTQKDTTQINQVFCLHCNEKVQLRTSTSYTRKYFLIVGTFITDQYVWFFETSNALWVTGLAISFLLPKIVGEVNAAEVRILAVFFLIVVIILTKLKFRNKYPTNFYLRDLVCEGFLAFWTAKLRRMMIMLQEEPICAPSQLLYWSTAVWRQPPCRSRPGRLELLPARWSAASLTIGDFFPMRSLQHVSAFFHWLSFCQLKLDLLQIRQHLTGFSNLCSHR